MKIVILILVSFMYAAFVGVAASETQDPPQLGDLPLAPFEQNGINVSMPIAKAEAILAQKGFESKPCKSGRIMGKKDSTYVIVKSKECDTPDSISVTYTRPADFFGAADLPALIETITGKVGGDPSCPKVRETSANCTWHAPANIANAKLVSLQYGPSRTTILIEAAAEPVQAETDTESSFITAWDIDFLSPFGAAGFMELGAFHDKLVAVGFTQEEARSKRGCEYTYNRKDEIVARVKLSPSEGKVCSPGARLAVISLTYSDHRPASHTRPFVAENIKAAWIDRLGEPQTGGSCTAAERSTVSTAKCVWATSPQPGLRAVNVERHFYHGRTGRADYSTLKLRVHWSSLTETTDKAPAKGQSTEGDCKILSKCWSDKANSALQKPLKD